MDGGKASADIKNIPAYVINMNERKDRLKRFMSQEAIHEFKNLKRISATNGKLLDFRRDKRISMSTKLRIYRNYRRSHYEIATLGAIGATISHVSVWKTFVKSGAPVCIVMEDDAVWTPEAIEQINKEYNNIPDKWGLWVLGYFSKTLIIEHIKDSKNWDKVYNFSGAHSYMITRETAIKLLEDVYPIDTHIEFYMTGSSIIKDFLIVENKNVRIDYFRTFVGPRVSTSDSNTSQHKENGCPSCDIPDDYKQIYKHFTRTKDDKMIVSGVVYGKQDNTILTFKHAITRKNKHKH
jgi:GR25 family glycosyltransferase involved in LPS biosynthesis